jgi:aconitate hydratase
LSNLPVADRATLANMAPEYGATVGFFPVDDQTLKYLHLTGRTDEEIALIESYCRKQGMFRTDQSPEPHFSSSLSLDLGTVEACLAGPKRPQDRVLLSEVKKSWNTALSSLIKEKDKKGNLPAPLGTEVEINLNGNSAKLAHGSVSIAAITSCTNTSNPAVLIAAGLLAQKAVQKGLKTKPWVKTSLAPGSKAVAEYLRASGLSKYLDQLGFQLVGYGCTTCIGNSGPLPDSVAKAVSEKNLIVAAVLSGNRNFEGRVNALVKANYLASPPLVVAYALAGSIDRDLRSEPLGQDQNGAPVYLKDIWPTHEEIAALAEEHVRRELFTKAYADVFSGGKNWREISVPESELYDWQENSTYIRRAPYFEKSQASQADISGARVLAVFGDSITTDHISPAGSFPKDSPAGQYLDERGVSVKDFNSYGSRRGNHEIMMRGTFANTRIKNLMLDTSGGYTLILPEKKQAAIFDAAEEYRKRKIPLIVLAGKEYGSGSSRDWAAKGPALLGVKAVIAQSFERIHRSNLVGMGILPLEFLAGQSLQTLGLTGFETFEIKGVLGLRPKKELSVRAQDSSGKTSEFKVLARIDTAVELEYWKSGGILPYVLEQILAQGQKQPARV